MPSFVWEKYFLNNLHNKNAAGKLRKKKTRTWSELQVAIYSYYDIDKEFTLGEDYGTTRNQIK